MRADMMQPLVGALSVMLAWLLVDAAAIKLRQRARLLRVLREFAGVPSRWVNASYALAIAIELAAASALLWPSTQRIGAGTAAALWFCYTSLLLRALLRGRPDVDCGCDSSAGDTPLDGMKIVRTATLALAAALVAWANLSTAPLGLHVFVDIVAGTALFALYHTCALLGSPQPTPERSS